MTLDEALNEIKSHGLYLVEDGAFGSYDEYVAKLNDLWVDMRDESELRSIDELIAEDDWYKNIVDDGFEAEKEPSEVIDEILNSVENDESIDTDSEFEYDDESELEDEDAEFTSYNDDPVENNIGLEDEENLYGESYNSGAQTMLNEAWYNNIGLTDEQEDKLKKLIDRYNSFASKRRDLNDRYPKGSMMKPSNRQTLFREFTHFMSLLEDLGRNNDVQKIQTMYLQKLTDEGYLGVLKSKNPDWSEENLVEFVGHADIPDAEEYLGLSQEERMAARHERERAENERREREEAARRERERRENPEPEDLVNSDDYVEAPEGEEELATRTTRRRRMRTLNRHYHDTNNIPTAIIKINIDTTNDPETLAEAEELVQTIKERFASEYANNDIYRGLCKVEAANVDIENSAMGEAGTEFHVVISMPAEIKAEIAEFVKNEMEDVFTFVSSEHPDDDVYSFETEGDRLETDEEEYDFEEPVVQPRRSQRPQVTSTRRIPRAKKWSVMYKVADEEGRDTGRTKWVHGVKAASAEDAMDKVENPPDIESAYATDVFKALRAVQR